MKIVDCVQGGAEWLQARAKRVTASEVSDAISFLKRKGKDGREAGDSSAAREAYKAALVAEILTGCASESYVSREMLDGVEREPYARAAYESRMGVMVDTLGFVVHPNIDRSGASPDGLVGDDGLIEIKCPKLETHLKYIFAGVLPADYEPQVMWQMACTGRLWCDFVSFDARLPPRHQLFVKRVYRDEQRIADMEAGVLQFLAEVDEMVNKLEAINAESEASDAPVADQFPGTQLTEHDLDLIAPRPSATK